MRSRSTQGRAPPSSSSSSPRHAPQGQPSLPPSHELLLSTPSSSLTRIFPPLSPPHDVSFSRSGAAAATSLSAAATPTAAATRTAQQRPRSSSPLACLRGGHHPRYSTASPTAWSPRHASSAIAPNATPLWPPSHPIARSEPNASSPSPLPSPPPPSLPSLHTCRSTSPAAAAWESSTRRPRTPSPFTEQLMCVVNDNNPVLGVYFMGRSLPFPPLASPCLPSSPLPSPPLPSPLLSSPPLPSPPLPSPPLASPLKSEAESEAEKFPPCATFRPFQTPRTEKQPT